MIYLFSIHSNKRRAKIQKDATTSKHPLMTEIMLSSNHSTGVFPATTHLLPCLNTDVIDLRHRTGMFD